VPVYSTQPAQEQGVPRLQREIVIDAPPEAVFAFLAQPERMPEWTPGVQSVKLTSAGPIGVGSTTETIVEVMGVKQTLVGRCTTFEPPHRFVVENATARGFSVGGVSVGRVQSTSTSELAPEGAGTRLHARLEYTVSAGFVTGLAESLIAPRMKADFEQSIQTLKRLLEARPAAG